MTNDNKTTKTTDKTTDKESNGSTSTQPKRPETPLIIPNKPLLNPSKFGSTDSIFIRDEISRMKNVNGSLERALEYSKKLQNLADSKGNLHKDIKEQILKVVIALAGADLEHQAILDELKAAKEELRSLKNDNTSTSRLKADKKRKLDSPESETPRSTKNVRQQPMNNEWQTVKSRKEPKGKEAEKPKEQRDARLKKPRADALVIGLDKDKPDMYAEVLKKIKEDQSLKEMGNMVMGVRKTRNGDMLIELKADPTVRSLNYKESIGKAVENVGIPLSSVKALTQVTTMECRNLDDVTTEDEFRAEMKKEFLLTDDQFNGPIRLRKSYNSTQIATFKVTDEEAKLMIKRGKVKVGWSVCVLRIPKEPIRCYKCLGFGHMKGNCKGEDKSKSCWNCGNDGHKSRDCQNNPKCLLCPEEESGSHATGSFKCKAYKEAVAKMTCK
jgi:hypothetical protein